MLEWRWGSSRALHPCAPPPSPTESHPLSLTRGAAPLGARERASEVAMDTPHPSPHHHTPQPTELGSLTIVSCFVLKNRFV